MLAAWAIVDVLRRAQAAMLPAVEPDAPARQLAAGSLWQLFGLNATQVAQGPPVLLVPAPIKRAAVLDLTARASLKRRLAALGCRPFLLAWSDPTAADDERGLAAYVHMIREAASVVRALAKEKPWLIGHSLGGTLCTIAALEDAHELQGLVLVHSPLAFAPGSSPFRDALAQLAPTLGAVRGLVPGTLLSILSTFAAPGTFLFARTADLWASIGDREALALHLAVERWTLDEIALPGALVREVVSRLWWEDALVRGRLSLAGRSLTPDDLSLPLLAVACPADVVAPPAAVVPFLAAVRHAPVRLVLWPFECGTVFAHFSAVLGRRAHARLWPAIVAWMRAQARPQ